MLTSTTNFLTLVLPENVTIALPSIPRVEMTTRTVELNETSKETPSDDIVGNKINKRACMFKKSYLKP